MGGGGAAGVRVAGAITILIAVAAWLALPAVREFIAVDRCLDQGGCWDAAHGKCEFKDQAKCTPEG